MTTSNGNDFLVLPPVDGWQVLGDSAGAFWIRDVDLGERVGLARPRDVRQTIQKAIGENVLKDWRAHGRANPTAEKLDVSSKPSHISEDYWRRHGRANPTAEKLDISGKPSHISEDYWRRHGGANPTAYFREVFEEVRSGKGRTQTMRAFYLNREATIVILARLRTKVAETMIASLIVGAVLAFETHARATIEPQKPASSGKFITHDELDRLLDAKLNARKLPAPSAPLDAQSDVDRWMIGVLHCRGISAAEQMRALVMVSCANCADSTCIHAACEYLCLSGSPPRFLREWWEPLQSVCRRTVASELDEMAKLGLIELKSEAEHFVFTLSRNLAHLDSRKLNAGKIEDNIAWMLKILRRRMKDVDFPPNLAGIFKDWRTERRIWHPYTDPLNLDLRPKPKEVPSVPLNVLAKMSPKAPQIVVPPPDVFSSVDKIEMLYDTLADMGVPHLRVKRAVKEVSALVDTLSVEELTKKALDFLSRR